MASYIKICRSQKKERKTLSFATYALSDAGKGLILLRDGKLIINFAIKEYFYCR
ncbi:conserved hypothetical protein [uncultured Dysgonomonas sp.]|uniref:Uncharacterized protein n=1 Tax=uncultured Dysgonomonas sp. TaxID=206096 RepID=A0A212K531_9BACT|nr:conserved hypothetical protein [uncultured Dysgonomonas sp.]